LGGPWGLGTLSLTGLRGEIALTWLGLALTWDSGLSFWGYLDDPPSKIGSECLDLGLGTSA